MVAKNKQKSTRIKSRGNYLKALKSIFSHQKDVYIKDNKNGKESTAIADIIERERQRRHQHFIYLSTAFLFLGAIATVIGFFYFNSHNPFAQEKVDIKITGASQAVSGEDTTYKISYANWGDVAINNAKLIIETPDTLTLTNAAPTLNGHTFELGEVESGERGEVQFTGQFLGELTQLQKISATLVFVPQNFSSEFNVKDEFSTSLQSAPITPEIKAPSNVIPGEKFAVQINLNNQSLSPVEKLRLKVVALEKMQFTLPEPSFEKDSSNWLTEKLNPKDNRSFKFTAQFPQDITFANDDERQQPIKIQVYLINGAGEEFLQNETTSYIQISEEPLSTHVIINGSTTDFKAGLGTDLNISTVFDNKGEDAFENATLILNFKSSPVDIFNWEKINDTNFGRIGKTNEGKNITWSSDKIEALKKIASNSKGSLNITLPIKSSTALTNLALTDLNAVTIEISPQLQLADQTIINGNKIVVKIKSDLNLTAKAMYYFTDGTPIGTGPLPPKATQDTEYVVSFDLNNKIHEVENIKVTTSLGDRVAWLANFKTSVGEVTFSAETKTLLWSINRLPANAPTTNLTFRVKLTPTSGDVGNLLKLTNPIYLSGHDTVADDDISDTLGILTTNLELDKQGIGKGIVIE